MTAFENRDTWEQRPRFKLRRIGVDGPYFLPIESITETLPILNKGFLSLEMKEGTTHEEAMALVDALTEKVAFLIYTGEVAPESAPGRNALKINKND